MFFKDGSNFMSLIFIFFGDKPMPEILFKLIEFMINLGGSEEFRLWMDEFKIDMYKELQFLRLTKFPELVEIDTIDEDMFLLRELGKIVVDISRLCSEDLVSEVSFDNEVEVFVGELVTNMWGMVQ